MVYIDKKGQKCEYQYCVVLREDEDKGIKHYVWVSEEQIQNIFDSCKFDNNGEVFMHMGHIAGQNKGEKADEVYFNKKKISSLEIRAENQETANKCAEYFKLPLPFPDYEKKIASSCTGRFERNPRP